MTRGRRTSTRRSTPAARWAHRVVRTGEVLLAAAVVAGVGLAAVHFGTANDRRVVLSAEHHPAAATTNHTLRVTSVSPAAGASAVSPTTTVEVRFSEPVVRGSALPSINPPIPGRWTRVGHSELRFTPSAPAMPLVTETITVPAGRYGVRADDGAELASSVTSRFQVRDGSILRLQQVLAQLGYLPLTWTQSAATPPASSGNIDLTELYQPPTGQFAWRYPSTPPTLQAAWKVGVDNHMTTGAMVAFEVKDGLPGYTSIRPPMWSALLTAEANQTMNPEGYTYALVSQTRPESLTLWHDGTVVYTSLVNTGIAQTPTPVGNFFVYRRFASTTMEGTNPNGSYYVDHGVRWVNYFDGGAAIHGFIRAAYGFPQSLGCVELPVAHAAIAWRWIHYGTVVTVLPEPGSTAA